MKGGRLLDRFIPRELVVRDPTCYEAKRSKVTRQSSSQDCQCIFCSLARLNCLEWRRFVAECKKSHPMIALPPFIEGLTTLQVPLKVGKTLLLVRER